MPLGGYVATRVGGSLSAYSPQGVRHDSLTTSRMRLATVTARKAMQQNLLAPIFELPTSLDFHQAKQSASSIFR